MRIAFYREKPSGNITHHHTLDDALTDLEIQQILKEFNAAHEETEAYVKNVKDGGLEEYLVKKCAEKVTIAKCDVEDAIDALNEAMSHLEWLQYKY